MGEAFILKQKILFLKIKLKFFHQIILYMEIYLEE